MIVHGSIHRAVEALDRGVFWYVPRPIWASHEIVELVREGGRIVEASMIFVYKGDWAHGQRIFGDFPDWLFQNHDFVAPIRGVLSELRELGGADWTVGVPLITNASIRIEDFALTPNKRPDLLGRTAFGDGFTFEGTEGPDDNLSKRPVQAGQPLADFTGNDRIHLYGGDDVWHGGRGNDRIEGGAGDDLLYGGPGADRLLGGRGDDVLYGGVGDDVILGGPGLDRLFGGGGDDDIRGGAGRDRIFGGPGDDVLRGEGGRDVIRGETGNDLVYGGALADRLHGGGGRDRLFGDTGDDWLHGGAGRDRLFGGAGDDRLYGGGGADRLVGGRGDDVLEGGPGRDYMEGGQGADRFVFRKGHQFAEIADLFPGDALVLRGFPELSNFAALQARLRDAPTGVILDFGDDWLVIQGQTKARLTPDYFDF